MSSNRRNNADNLNYALVGCGELTKTVRLPVSILADKVTVAVLVDEVLPRARKLVERYSVPAVASNYRDILPQVEAAIDALPHHLHAPVTLDLLRHGIHGLVEKPMALATSDSEQRTGAADQAGVIQAVGLHRRFYESSRFVQRLVDCGILGNLLSVYVSEGIPIGEAWLPISGCGQRRAMPC